jgi:GTP-binding protein
LKQQKERLRRAAKRTPLVISAASGKGVPEALRAVLGVVDGQAAAVGENEAVAEWRP